MVRNRLRRYPKLVARLKSLRNTMTHRFLVPGRKQRLFWHRPSQILAGTAAVARGYQEDDRQIVERVVAAYRRAVAESGVTRDSMWRDFFERYQGEIHRVFMEGSVESAAAILRNPGDSNLFHGFEGLSLFYRKERLIPKDEAKNCLDALLRLAEAIGACRIYNPETYIFSDSLRPRLKMVSADSVLADIERTLGIPIPVPNPYPDESGVQTSRGVVAHRVPWAIYQAWRVRELIADIPSPRVLEIGAGLGRTAYYARKLGILDYTIVDIPFTSISQGYFLGRTLGADAVLLAGESSSDLPKRIKILPPGAFLNADTRYDLVLNVDSLTEVGRETADAYWKQIESRAGLFLSINHEANPYTVREIVLSSPRVTSYTRYPYWMRRGYVEETVRLGGDR
jgi:hypothetical protein